MCLELNEQCISQVMNDLRGAKTVEYIRYNPVRAGLVSEPENWPYVYFHDGQLFADQR